MKIHRLRVKRVDLVGMGASYDPSSDVGARVLLYKAADMKACKECGYTMAKEMATCPKCGAKFQAGAPPAPKEKQMTLDLSTLPKEAQEHISTLEKSIETLTAEVAALKAKPAPAPAADPPTDVLKGATPEVRALLEKAQSESAEAKKQAQEAMSTVAKMEDSRRLAEVTERVNKELKHAAGTSADALAKALKNVIDHCPEDAKVIEGVLKTSSALIGKSVALKSLGSDQGDGGGDAMTQVNSLVAKKLSEKTAKDAAEAMSQVFSEHPDLYNAYRISAAQKVGRLQVGSE